MPKSTTPNDFPGDGEAVLVRDEPYVEPTPTPDPDVTFRELDDLDSSEAWKEQERVSAGNSSEAAGEDTKVLDDNGEYSPITEAEAALDANSTTVSRTVDGEIVHGTPPNAEVIIPEGIPAPINPLSDAGSHQDRVQYENWVNGEAENFANVARHRFLDAILAGKAPGDIEVVVKGEADGDDAPDDADSPIAPDTAIAAALDSGLTPYADWSKDDLADECRNRDLPVSGTKVELIERLEASDSEDVAEATSTE